jgi:hypothetical protein
MTSLAEMPDAIAPRFPVLREIERRVLWLATAIVDHANRVRPNPSGLKVGGHQASSASLVTIMTALWFRHLRVQDRVSVKPNASPVLHAVNHADRLLLVPTVTWGGCGCLLLAAGSARAGLVVLRPVVARQAVDVAAVGGQTGALDDILPRGELGADEHA